MLSGLGWFPHYSCFAFCRAIWEATAWGAHTTTYNARGLFEGSSGIDTYISSTDYTATGGIDEQALGNGVINHFTYNEVSNRLDRIYTSKPGYLALVDLSYEYDPAGNISSIGDGVRQETREYQYDFLDRLTFAGVYAGQQMIEERYYTYNQLGNLLSFRHRYPSAGQGRGAFAVGDELSSTNNTTRGNFNGLSSTGMSSTNHSGSAVMPYVYGFGGEGSQGGYNTRGSLASGIQGEGSNYQGAGSFNPMTGASESAGYDSRGVTSFVRGIEGGFGGWEGNEYTGPFGETTIDYTYPDNGVRPHAVTARSNGDVFSYDDNGNMTSRTQEGVTWTQVFDAENRLVSVSNNTTPATTTTYVYDGSGGRLKRIVNESGTITTTLYVAGMEIETVGGTEAKRTVYYPSGGAFRVIGGSNAGLYYRHSDHLGSTSVLSDANGMKVSGSDVVYAPFGEVRSGEQSTLTDFGYTGQRHDDSTGGLMYYGARYYLPGIQHFVSADTIVPEPANPQAFNRYSYVVNNPVRLIDPTGHAFAQGAGFGGVGTYKPPVSVCVSHPSACGGTPPSFPNLRQTTQAGSVFGNATAGVTASSTSGTPSPNPTPNPTPNPAPNSTPTPTPALPPAPTHTPGPTYTPTPAPDRPLLQPYNPYDYPPYLTRSPQTPYRTDTQYLYWSFAVGVIFPFGGGGYVQLNRDVYGRVYVGGGGAGGFPGPIVELMAHFSTDSTDRNQDQVKALAGGWSSSVTAGFIVGGGADYSATRGVDRRPMLPHLDEMMPEAYGLASHPLLQAGQ